MAAGNAGTALAARCQPGKMWRGHALVSHSVLIQPANFCRRRSSERMQVCTVFAQLTVSGKYQGPHVFVVRIRDDSGRVATGVRIEDNGPKMGLNGVDNGRIWFDDVRVPLDNLLDRYASVAPDGTYSSPIPTVSARFGAPPLAAACVWITCRSADLLVLSPRACRQGRSAVAHASSLIKSVDRGHQDAGRM